VTREAELHEPERHAETGRREAVVPVQLLAEGGTDQRPQRRPDVDAHVEDREPGIAPGATFGI
jgi:hypothetical protein